MDARVTANKPFHLPPGYRVMDRRAFIGGLAFGTLAAPHVARAQPERKVYRIGILSSRSTTSEMVGPQPQDPLINALLRGLRELGYVYGEQFVTEPRGGEGKPERFPALATELVRLQVDGRDCRLRAHAACAQARNLDDPCRHDGRRRPRGLGVCPKPRTSGRKHHRVEPSDFRDDGEAT